MGISLKSFDDPKRGEGKFVHFTFKSKLWDGTRLVFFEKWTVTGWVVSLLHRPPSREGTGYLPVESVNQLLRRHVPSGSVHLTFPRLYLCVSRVPFVERLRFSYCKLEIYDRREESSRNWGESTGVSGVLGVMDRGISRIGLRCH